MYSPIESLPEKLQGQLTVIDFGTNWCGYCQAAAPLVQSVASRYPDIQHVQIEDGKGRRLGRMHTVKLWPTLIFLKNGVEVKRLVRPDNTREIEEAFSSLLQESK